MNKRNMWKALVLFFSIMFVLTIVSRAADSIIVPVVTTETMQGNNLVYNIYGDGKVVSQDKMYQSVISGIRVDKIYVKSGDSVEKGDILFAYNIEDLVKSIQKIESEKEKIILQIKEKKLVRNQEHQEEESDNIDVLQMEYDKAVDDLKMAKEALTTLKKEHKRNDKKSIEKLREEKEKELDKNTVSITQKKEELATLEKSNENENRKQELKIKTSKSSIDKKKEKLTSILNNTYDKSNITKQQKAKLNEAQKAYEDALSQLFNYDTSYSYEYRYKLYTEAEQEYEQMCKDFNMLIDKEVQKIYDDLEAEYEQATKEYDDLNGDYEVMLLNQADETSKLQDEIDSLEEINKSLLELINSIDEGKYIQDDLVKQQKVEVKAAKQDIREKKYQVDRAKLNLENEKERVNAPKKQLQDNSEEIAQLGIKSLQIDLDNLEDEQLRLEQIKKEKGYCKASLTGNIISMDVVEGKPSGDNSVITIGGKVSMYEAKVSSENGKYIEVGDQVTLTRNGKNDKVITQVESVQEGYSDDKQSVVIVKAIIPNDYDVKNSDVVEFSMQKVSSMYENCIPLQAVRGSGTDAFVYVITKKDTIMGERSVAEKRAVRVINKDSQTAVLDVTDTLSSTDVIIVSSNKIVNEGDNVRLAASNSGNVGN